ncbi:heparinase II/III family protein [Candidatus Pelagibacter communis]|uniref:heparinase II/III family protein n=1 Tax=Pelagibacter ubique TaxID=198252 RepID=UPI001178B5B2|nr:alginate lyase family protein [Candidatus Pelagibacter ubique]
MVKFNKIKLYYYTLRDLKLSQFFFFLKFFFIKYKFFEEKHTDIKKFCKKKKKINFIEDVNDYKKIIFHKKFSNLKKFERQNNDLQKFNLFYLNHILNKNLSIKKKQANIKKFYEYSLINRNSIAWHPYPTSLRLMNLIKFKYVYNINSKFIDNFIYSHFSHLKKNLEYNLGANHLLTNVIALNKFFTICLHKTKKIKEEEEKYRNELDEILNYQFNLNFHYENSPKYHLFLIKLILDLEILKKVVGKKNDKKNIMLIKYGITFINNISHPDNILPFFNDTNKNHLNLKEVKKSFKDNFGNLEKIKIKNFIFPVIYNKKFKLITKCSEPNPKYNPGHTNGDNLSFELSILNKRILTGRGISTYENNNDRKNQRSSSNHNTIEIDNLSANEVWKSFRVARKSKILNLKISNNSINAQCLGYFSGSNFSTHKRKWILNNKSLEIIDNVKNKDFKIHFNFSPETKVKYIKKFNYYSIKNGNVDAKISFESRKHSLKEINYYEDFENIKKSFCIEIISKDNCKTLINLI